MGILRKLTILFGFSVLMVVVSSATTGLGMYAIISSYRVLLHEQAQDTAKALVLIRDAYGVQSTIARLIREQDIDAIEKLMAQDEKISKTVEQDIADMSGSEAIKAAFSLLLAANTKVKNKFLEGNSSLAGQLVAEEAGPAFEAFFAAIDTRLQQGQERLAQKMAEAEAVFARQIKFIMAGLGFVVCLYVALGAMLRRSIVQGMQSVSDTIRDASSSITVAVSELFSASDALAQSSCEQAASLEETTASISEVDSVAKSTLENAEAARQCGEEARTAAEAGEAQVRRMTEAMDAIKGSSDEVAKIVKVIDGIAFQTNLLALNAAVEAARAGEAGRGFAVVADEVRNLAQRSATSAKETSEKIADSLDKATAGVAISREMSETLDQIVGKVKRMDTGIKEITNASREQSHGITQIDSAITHIDTATQAVAASAEEMAASAGSLKEQTARLEESVMGLDALLHGGKASSSMKAEVPGTKTHLALAMK